MGKYQHDDSGELYCDREMEMNLKYSPQYANGNGNNI